MESSTKSIQVGGWLHDLNSILGSALVHLSLLIVLGLLATSSGSLTGGGGNGVRLMMDLGGGPAGSGGDDKSIDLSDTLETTPPVIAPPVVEPEKVAAVENPVAAVGAIPLDTATLAANDKALNASLSDQFQLADAGRGPGFGPGFGGDGTGGSGGQGLGKGPASTDFFGISGYGKTFVYVVDCSDSMNERGKFERARYELLQSIEQLDSDSRYYVIFYNDNAYPMDAEKPIQATQKAVAETVRWVNSVDAIGGTNPLPALIYALSLRPDAIYFLSDGQFDPMTIQEMRYRNRSNRRLRTQTIPIHTVAFMDRMTEGLMRSIARNSGGEYRFVGE
jgi:hypothetical protein